VAAGSVADPKMLEQAEGGPLARATPGALGHENTAREPIHQITKMHQDARACADLHGGASLIGEGPNSAGPVLPNLTPLPFRNPSEDAIAL
jgi:hypothetical protein